MSVYGGLVPLAFYPFHSTNRIQYTICGSPAQLSIHGLFAGIHGLFAGTVLFFMAPADAAVDQQSHQGQQQRSAEDQPGKQVAFAA